MANTEWNVPFTLKSPKGSLALNDAIGSENFCFLMNPPKCSMQVDHLRVTTDDVPAGDGGISRKTWSSFYTCKLALQYWVGETPEARVPACESDRREMDDLLMRHLYALIRPSVADLDAGDCQLFWTPSGDSSTDDRLLHRITLVQFGPGLDDGEGAFEVEFELRTELPYALDKTLVTTTFDSADDTTLTNPGTAAMWPVFRVHADAGDVNSFELSNVGAGEGGTDLTLNWDGSQPGSSDIPNGDYIEIDTFHQTMYLNGDGANMEAGIDQPSSDYWPLFPDDNLVRFIAPGGSLEVFWQAAWF